MNNNNQQPAKHPRSRTTWSQPPNTAGNTGVPGTFIVTGESPVHSKLGRNQPCWCGSGEKYKRCHLHRDLQ